MELRKLRLYACVDGAHAKSKRTECRSVKSRLLDQLGHLAALRHSGYALRQIGIGPDILGNKTTGQGDYMASIEVVEGLYDGIGGRGEFDDAEQSSRA